MTHPLEASFSPVKVVATILLVAGFACVTTCAVVKEEYSNAGIYAGGLGVMLMIRAWLHDGRVLYNANREEVDEAFALGLSQGRRDAESGGDLRSVD